MFGDIGHGAALFMIGAFLCLFNDCILKAVPGLAGMLKGRYLFLLMGLFGCFCGIMYNDFMAIPLFHPWGSCYEIEVHGHEKHAVPKPDCIQPFGLDPIWYISTNELTFFNSLKMKVSVILGVA